MSKTACVAAALLLTVLTGNPVFAEPEISSAVKEGLGKQTEKEKRDGYQNYELLHVARQSDRVRLVYVAENPKKSELFGFPDKDWLMGYTLTRNYGKWFYVGGRSTVYSSEQSLEDMKSWADEIR